MSDNPMADAYQKVLENSIADLNGLPAPHTLTEAERNLTAPMPASIYREAEAANARLRKIGQIGREAAAIGKRLDELSGRSQPSTQRVQPSNAGNTHRLQENDGLFDVAIEETGDRLVGKPQGVPAKAKGNTQTLAQLHEALDTAISELNGISTSQKAVSEVEQLNADLVEAIQW